MQTDKTIASDVPAARRRLLKRLAWVVPMISAMWYAFVVFLLPRLPWDAQSAHTALTVSCLVSHHRAVASGLESFGDVSGSPTLRRITDAARTRRRVIVHRTSSGDIDAVVVYPLDDVEYRYGLVSRILLLCFESQRIPSYLLTREGALYRARGFHEAHPPSSLDLAAPDQPSGDNPWRFEMRIAPVSAPAHRDPQ